jgi:hypothetical protein
MGKEKGVVSVSDISCGGVRMKSNGLKTHLS